MLTGRAKRWLLFGFVAFAISACAPNPGGIIRAFNTAEEPPGDLSAFFMAETQRDHTIWTDDYLPVHVCGATLETCNTYDTDYWPAFLEGLGPVRYSEPVKQILEMNLQINNYRSSGMIERWRTCFRPENSDRLYYFFSRGKDFVKVHSKAGVGLGGTLLYRDPINEDYQEELDLCGPFIGTTRIVIPPT